MSIEADAEAANANVASGSLQLSSAQNIVADSRKDLHYS